MSISEIIYTMSLYKKYILKNQSIFFFSKFWIGKFFRQLWEKFEEIQIRTVAEHRTQIGHQKHIEVQSTETKEGNS